MKCEYTLPPVEKTRPEMLEKAQPSDEVLAVEAAMINVVKCAPYRYNRKTKVAVSANGAIVGNWANRASRGHDKKGRGHL